MSIVYDTLEYDGVERTFDQRFFSRAAGIIGKRYNQKPDTFTVTVANASIADDPVFPYEAAIIVRTNRISTDGSDNSFSGGTTKFQGKRTQNPLKAARGKHGVTYEFQGPWYDLSISPYLQTYKGHTTNYNPGEVVLNTAAAPLISTSGLRFISVGDQIQCILQFVLDSYADLSLPAPFQYVGRDLVAGAINLDVGAGPPSGLNENTDASGFPYLHLVNADTTIDLDLFKHFLKSEILRPMSAAEFIQKLLEASPRTNVAFDYSTTPPTIYFGNIDNGADISFPLFNGVDHKSIDLQRRDDLIPSSVIIGYRITNTSGGSTFVDYAIDKYGPNGSNNIADPDRGPGVIVQILDLQGFNISFATGHLDCEPLACIGGTHKQRRAWWVSKRGGETEKLATTKVRFQDDTAPTPHPTSIADAKIYYASDGFDSTGAAVTANQEFTTADYAFFTNRLVRGGQSAWMTVGGGSTPVKSVKVKISSVGVEYAEYEAESAKSTAGDPADYEIDTAGGKPRRIITDLHATTIELTNGVTGDYSTVASSIAGEAYIIGEGGIAQYLFDMLSTPQYEGEYVKIETSFSSTVSLLNRANLTGGRAEWETMHAQIQEVTEDWVEKETSIRIGVSKHLNADQLSAFLNMWRYRRAWYNPLLKADNTVATDGEIKLPMAVGNANTVEGVERTKQHPITYFTTPPTGTTAGVVGGQINHEPKIINDTLSLTTPIAADGFTDADTKVMQPREVLICLPDGSRAYMIVHATAPYTKS